MRHRGGRRGVQAGVVSACSPLVRSPRRPEWPIFSSTGRSRRGERFRILRTDCGFRIVGRTPAEEELEARSAAGAKAGDEVVVGRKTLEIGDAGLLGGPSIRRTWATSRSFVTARATSASIGSSFSSLPTRGTGGGGRRGDSARPGARCRSRRRGRARSASADDGHASRAAVRDPLFSSGADEFADFLAWKEPEAVLGADPLVVGERPGYAVLDAPRRGARHVLRDRADPGVLGESPPRRAGEPIADLVPPGRRGSSGSASSTVARG